MRRLSRASRKCGVTTPRQCSSSPRPPCVRIDTASAVRSGDLGQDRSTVPVGTCRACRDRDSQAPPRPERSSPPGEIAPAAPPGVSPRGAAGDDPGGSRRGWRSVIAPLHVRARPRGALAQGRVGDAVLGELRSAASSRRVLFSSRSAIVSNVRAGSPVPLRSSETRSRSTVTRTALTHSAPSSANRPFRGARHSSSSAERGHAVPSSIPDLARCRTASPVASMLMTKSVACGDRVVEVGFSPGARLPVDDGARRELEAPIGIQQASQPSPVALVDAGCTRSGELRIAS